MNFSSRITGVGSFVPKNIFTNHDLEKMMDTSDEWIQQRTGIVERRWVDQGTSTSDLAVEASIEAIKNAGIDKSEIDMIVFATLSPDHDFPGSGCFLQAKLGIPEIPAIDIRQQCTGFIYAMSIADKFIKSGSHKNILVVGAEVHSKGLDRTPEGRNVGVLFGDGAGAVVMSQCSVSDSSKDSHFINAHLHCDGSYAKELWLPAPGTGFDEPDRMNQKMLDEKLHYPYMNGKTVFVHAVKRMSESLSRLCAEQGVTIDDIDLFLFHQANLRINSKIAEMMNIPEEKVFNTIQKYGNTTAATIPLGMNDAIKEGKLKPGMLVASAAFGSGFTWASALYRF
ncbi:3-oxoacyl-ACP synthase III family protein [Bacteriovorax sp. Seq25_V]|uniref:3-oxoacyl-ACP synthase III family protein n=1 Tax=Bacteriovorax sp. Seq25_V TaxID=1201288 RepID=UPI00038A1EEE|nr:beta-ketoacyl-ACP synthase III [Bacteriovorax sp. Seq25_V]EQC43806.1 beta-ketoacyl-acyl-carrier-protein synthase III [Bacteriovorax sp. Seq25_V]